MKDNRVRIQFEDEVLIQLQDKLKEVKSWIPSATLSNVVNNELKQQLKRWNTKNSLTESSMWY